MENELLIPFCCPFSVSPVGVPSPIANNSLVLKGLAQQSKQLVEEQADSLAIERLEAKMDMLILLMSEVLRQQHPLPAPRSLALGREAIRLPEPITVGAQVHVTLYLANDLPLPVVLTATCLSQSEQHSLLRLDNVSDEEDHWLGQLLFREHRRQLREAH